MFDILSVQQQISLSFSIKKSKKCLLCFHVYSLNVAEFFENFLLMHCNECRKNFILNSMKKYNYLEKIVSITISPAKNSTRVVILKKVIGLLKKRKVIILTYLTAYAVVLVVFDESSPSGSPWLHFPV